MGTRDSETSPSERERYFEDYSMMYDWTDNIFNWKGWHIFKWITGIIICGLLLIWMWDVNNSNILEKKLIKLVSTHWVNLFR